MNEIRLPAFRSGAEITYEVLNGDGTVITPAGTPLPEIRSTGYYTADNDDVTAGDIVVIKEGATVVGGGAFGTPASEQYFSWTGYPHPQPHSIFGF